MSRPIDADALREQLQWRAYDDWNQGVVTSWADAYREVIDMIDDMPSVVPSAQPLVIHCTDCEDWFERQSISGFAISELPPAQPDGWLERNKDEILKAGIEGREVEFRISGRLFAIREKAQ